MTLGGVASTVPVPLGRVGGRLRLMCEDDADDRNPHHAQVDSQPPRCNRHFALHKAHLAANRQRKKAGLPQQEWEPDVSPEDQGHMVIDPADVQQLAELLGRISYYRAAMWEHEQRPARYAKAVKGLHTEANQLAQFFYELGIEEVRGRRLDR